MLHILLPVHNRKEITRQFVQQLKEQTYLDYHLIVIDDGSSDKTEEMVKEELPAATILKGNGKLWWAGSLQKGFDWLKKNADKSDIVLIINDDVNIGNDYLDTGIKLLNPNENRIVYTKCVSKQSDKLFWSGIKLDWKRFRFLQVYNTDEVNCVSTRGVFLRYSDIQIIGNFHPLLLPHYSSDYEYTYRAFKKGFTFFTADNLNLVMDEDTSGLRNVKFSNYRVFLVKYFSKRNPVNPFYLTTFILLACPPKFIVQNLSRILYGTISSLIKRRV